MSVAAVGLLVTLSTILSAQTTSAAAAPALSLTTTPVSLDLTIHPGTSTTKTLQLMNNTAQPIPINMSLDVFGAYGTTGQAAITAPKASDVSSDYVHFSPSSFIAQPGKWSQVQMTIKLPSNASLGYYFAVIFKPVLANPLVTKSAIIKGSNAVLVLVDTQSSNEVRQVEIGNFSVSKKLYEYLPATFTVSIHNTGNIFLAPTGDIFISRSSNLTHALTTLSVNAGSGNVLPNSYRNFQEVWSDGFPVFQDKLVNGHVVTDKKGNDILKLKWNFADSNKFRFGKYYAGLTLIYNNGTRTIPLTAVVSFWVIPWKLLLLALIPLLLVLYGFWSIGRAIYRRLKRLKKANKASKPKPPVS